MMPIKFAQDGSRFQNSLLIRRQQRHYIALEHLGKWIGPVAPPVPLARLRGVLAAAPLARAPHAHPRACRCRLLRLAFHQLPPQHPDLRVLYHGAASPGSISQTRRQDGDYRQFYLSRSSDLIVADQMASSIANFRRRMALLVVTAALVVVAIWLGAMARGPQFTQVSANPSVS